MKKGLSTTIALLLATWATGQITEGRRAFLTPAQTQHVATFDSWELRHYNAEQGLLRAPVLPPTSPAYSPAGKTALLNPVIMGQASNVCEHAANQIHLTIVGADDSQLLLAEPFRLIIPLG